MYNIFRFSLRRRILIAITFFLNATGVAGVCELIGRDSDPDSVATNIAELTAAYCDRTEIVHKTILDFGCGGGGSTVVLAKLFPQCQVVGIDLREDKIRLARARAQHHRLENVAFFVAPSGTELPPDIGPFDFVYLFAVYEHLLPAERPIIMKLVWSRLKPGGIPSSMPRRIAISQSNCTAQSFR